MGLIRIKRGVRFTIYAIEDANGRCPVIDFIDGLTENEKKKIDAKLKYTCNIFSTNKEHIKSLKGHDLIELKIYQVRLLGRFASGKRIILTHGFKKKKDTTPKQEIDRAERLLTMYFKDE